MSFLLYYSNHCNHSKKLVQHFAKSKLQEDIHFICIDNRRTENKKTYIRLENGSEIVMPNNINAVPALLMLSDFSVVYGEDIYKSIKPREVTLVEEATNSYMEPLAFSLGNSCNPYGIVSDQYSFVDMNSEELTAQGNGGTRQMHNYLPLEFNQQINTPKEYDDLKNVKLGDDMTIEKIKQNREKEMNF